MLTRTRMPLVPVTIILFSLLGVCKSWPHHQDSEQDLTRRIEQEHNPVKKAKYQIRLGRLKLLHGISACDQEDHAGCGQSLDAYLKLMQRSWRGLQATGRKAVKHPQGYRALDIALRENGLLLEDLKHRLPFADHAGIDQVLKQNEGLHDEVFKALFPGAVPPASGPMNDHPDKNPKAPGENQP